MDPKIQTLFFALALVCFIVDAVKSAPHVGARVALQSLGLAFAVFPFLWNAAEAGW